MVQLLQQGLKTNKAGNGIFVWTTKKLLPTHTKTSALTLVAPVPAAKVHLKLCLMSRTTVNTALQQVPIHLLSSRYKRQLPGHVQTSHTAPTGCQQSTSSCLNWHANSASAARPSCMQWYASCLNRHMLQHSHTLQCVLLLHCTQPTISYSMPLDPRTSERHARHLASLCSTSSPVHACTNRKTYDTQASCHTRHAANALSRP